MLYTELYPQLKYTTEMYLLEQKKKKKKTNLAFTVLNMFNK